MTTTDAHLPDPRLRLQGPASGERVFDGFVAACAARPEATAIVHGAERWTYAQLDRASRALAIHLLGRPASGDVVALYATRSPALIVGMLACLRAGLPFAVLDTAYPAARLAQLLDVARPGRFVVLHDDPATIAALQLPDVVLRIDAAQLSRWRSTEPDRDPRIDAGRAEQIAYLLFTSGSTGTPKGIRTAHAPLVHFVRWYAPTFGADADARFSMLSGIAHDPVLRDVFVPLSVGAAVHVPEPAVTTNPAALYEWLAEQKITHVHATPQLCKLVAAGRRGRAPLDQLRFVFSGGDMLFVRQALEIEAFAPRSKVVNFYGATETPQAMAHHVFDKARDGRDDIVPVGRGIADVQVLVLDDERELAAAGIQGEIAIRTKFLSAGYVGDEGLTSARFVAHTAAGDPDDRLYLTGDRGCFRPDGAVVVQGRSDDQVKVRGFRVELAEVTRAIQGAPGIDAAAVLAERTPDGEQRLVAYIVGGDEARAKATLAAQFPAYMVPARWVKVPALPLLSNGKLDRQGLQAMAPAAAVPAIDEGDGTLATIAAQWRRVLGRDDVHADASFLDLGGDSLSSVEAATLLESVLGTLPDRWETMTIRELGQRRRAKASRWARVEAPVLVRALAISLMVGGHFGLGDPEGTPRALFVVSGISLGRYLVPSVLRTGRVSALTKLAFRVALPTMLYTLLLQLAFTSPKWQSLLLVSNLMDPNFDRGLTFWFIDVFVQNLLLLAGVLAFPPVRAATRSSPFAVAMTGTLAFVAIAAVGPHVWNTDALYGRVPHLFLGFVFLGWAISLAESARRQVAVTIAALLVYGVPLLSGHGHVLLPFALTVALVFVRQVPLPPIAGRVVNAVAAASLFIYLTHFQVRAIVLKTPLAGRPVVALLGALVVGVVAWRSWELVRVLTGRLWGVVTRQQREPAPHIAT